MQSPLKNLLYQGIKGRVSYTSNPLRPLVAAHRGMSGILPENTKEALLASLYEGSDFVELDVVLTKDHQVLVAHDTYLSRLTNVQDMPEFQERKIKRTLDGKEKDDWWIQDFTVQELKKLGIRQSILTEQRLQIFNHLFTFPTLEEVIVAIKDFNLRYKGSRNPDSSLAGILLEIKDRDFHLKYSGVDISQYVLDVLKEQEIESVEHAQAKCPIVLMSFEEGALKHFANICDLPRLYLVWKLSQLHSLDKIKQLVDGIGIDLKLIWDKERDRPSPLVNDIRAHELLLYCWTAQDDNTRRMGWMNARNSNELYWKMTKVLHLDGIITEFPERAVNIIQMIIEGQHMDRTNPSSSNDLSSPVVPRKKSY